MSRKKSPAEQLSDFLNFVDQCRAEYKYAYDAVGEEDKRLQDLLHEVEFAPDRAARNRAAAKLQQSRKRRRESKDQVQLYEKIVAFFDEQKNRETLNRMRQLLGQQRKAEEYLNSERHYKPRMED